MQAPQTKTGPQAGIAQNSGSVQRIATKPANHGKQLGVILLRPDRQAQLDEHNLVTLTFLLPL